MRVEDNIDLFAEELGSFGEEFEGAITTTLQQLQGEVERQLIQDVNRHLNVGTGDLLRSIEVNQLGDRLELQMLDYGFYQLFGVKGSKRSRVFGLGSDIASAFGKNTDGIFQFRKTNHPGLFGLQSSADLINSIPTLITDVIFDKTDLD